MKFLYVIKLFFTSPAMFFGKVAMRMGIPNSNVKKIIKHNVKVWPGYKNPNAESVILFDYYPLSETELGRSYYLIGANDPNYRKDGAGGFVVLEQIRYCIEQGLSYVDFMGINSLLRGDFKISLNADPVSYFEFTLG